MNGRMTLGTLVMFGLAVLSTTACKGKRNEAAGTGSGSATATTDAAPPIDAPARPAMTLAPGPTPTLGCFAWSDALKAPACVVGSVLNDAPDLAVEYVGASEPSTKLTEQFDAAGADAVNRILAKHAFTPLTASATTLTAGQAATVGAVTITWTRTQTAPGGDNQAPTTVDRVVATCRGAEVELAEDEVEGGAATFKAWSIGDRVVVELGLKIAREGEYGEQLEAVMLDAASCTVAGKR